MANAPTTENQPLLESPDPREREVQENNEAVTAQVSPAAPAFENIIGDRDSVDVSETSVKLDTVITDPSAPEAVVVPPEGRGDLTLPIHALTGPTAEELLASGDAPEATAVVDGETVNAEQAEKKAKAKS